MTELTAKPLLAATVPELAGFGQPLAGEVAARRELLDVDPVPHRLRRRDRDAGRGLEPDRPRRHGPGRPRAPSATPTRASPR